MTKGINRRSFHRIPGKPDTLAYLVRSLLDYHYFVVGPTPFSFPLGTGSSPDFHGSKCSSRSRVVFSDSPSAGAPPLFFVAHSRVLFYRPFDEPSQTQFVVVVAVDRGFAWQTCPTLSMSVRCFFTIDHLRWLSRSLTGNNVYTMTAMNDVLGNISLSQRYCTFLEKLMLLYSDAIRKYENRFLFDRERANNFSRAFFI